MDTSMKSLFDMKFIEQLWREHKGQKKDKGLKIFGLLCYGLWKNSLEQHRKSL